MIPVVIVQVPQQREKVRRLVDYCFDLDDTEVIVLKADDKIANIPNVAGGGNGAQLCFELAAREFQHTPFFWLEADSIPLGPGWQEPIEKEWKDSGKKFLLPKLIDVHPYDGASAIGIYPAGTIDIIPHNMFWPRLWDLWLYQEIPNEIHFTQLIQHSYAPINLYPHRYWQFPADKHIIRPGTLIFHRDPYQTLLGGKAPRMDTQHELAIREAERTKHLGTSAGNRQKNLSTSAELFQ
jgi:hypothetical protein